VEYSPQSSGCASLGTTLETIERIHNLNRICLLTVKEAGFKILHSKHFPAIFIRYYVTPPEAATTTPVTEEEKKTTEDKGTTTETKTTKAKEEIDPGLFDCTIHSTDPSALEKLHSGFVGWFPELSQES
jgi:guanylate kinase